MKDIAMTDLDEFIMSYVKDVMEEKENKTFLLKYTKDYVSTVISRLIDERNINLLKIKFFIRQDRDSCNECTVQIRYIGTDTINKRSTKNLSYEGLESIDAAAAYLDKHPNIKLVRIETDIPLEQIYGSGFLAARRRNTKYSVTVCRRFYPENTSLVRVRRIVSE